MDNLFGVRTKKAIYPYICKVVFVLLGIGALLPTASAANYYFSDCATGGNGTINNPYCLDPDGDGIKQSFQYLMDGVGPEVTAGDTIYLCAGACDGAGSATYHLTPTGTTTEGYSYTFAPRVSGTSQNPITIRTYPGETVILSGDTNGDGVMGSNEVTTLLTNDTSAAAAKAWYVWRDLIFERSKGIMINLRRGPSNWTFDNIEIRYTGALWNGGDFYTAGCDPGSQAFGIKIADATGNFTVKNSRLHHICGIAHRHTVNPNLTAGIFENNEYYNLGYVNNEFIGKNTTWRNNYIHDVIVGFSEEEEMQNVVIEDNILACLGEYMLTADWRCSTAISINNGDNGSTTYTTNDITIRRNKIYGVTHGIYAGNNRGWWISGIQFTAINGTTGVNSVIENNMVWHIQSAFSNLVSAAIYVDTTTSVVVQNNTVYDSHHGIIVKSAAHTIRSNLVVQSYSYRYSSKSAEIIVDSSASGSTLGYNNVHYGNRSNPVLQVGGTTYNCIDTLPGTGNRCALTTFVNVSGSKSTWNLHLVSSDTANKDHGTTGASEDIDRQLRTGTPDIGADEITTGNPNPPPLAPTNLIVQ